MTAVVKSLQTVSSRCPKHLLDDLRVNRDERAQCLRRALLHGSRVLVVMAGYPGEAIRRDYFERAHELGVDIVLLEDPRQIHLATELIDDRLVAMGLACNLSDDASSRRHVLDVVRRNGPFHGVVTFIEFGLSLAAWLAQELGLPGNDHEIVLRGRDKEKMRRAAYELGLPTPRFYRITSSSDLEAAAREVGFPAILKPVAGLTSIEVHHVNNASELTKSYHSTIDHLEKGEHANPGMLSMIWNQGRDLVLEHFLDGREFDIDFLLSEGECVYAAVTDNVAIPGWPTILGRANMPTTLSDEENSELISDTITWTQQLGYREGAFHVEVKTDRSGQRFLLEVNARLGGASQYQLNKAVWGVDLVEELLLNCVGIPICPAVNATPRSSFAVNYLPSPLSGLVSHSDFLVPIQVSSDKERLLVCEPWVQAGERVNGPSPGPPDWLGELTVGGDTLEAADRLLSELLGRIDYAFIVKDDSENHPGTR